MREVFRHSDAGLVAVRQSVLENAGVVTFVRNADTQQVLVAGLLTALFPLPDFWPTLCVLNDADYPVAMVILRHEDDDEATAQPDWKCPQCGQTVPGDFADCWNCRESPNR